MKQFVSAIRIADRNEDGLGSYLNKISHFQTLSQTEECALANEYQRTGNQKALDRLIDANLRFVVKVAKCYQGNGLSLPDLIEEGNVGLVSAAKSFNGNYGYKFISYAAAIIDQHILHAIQKLGRTIHKPKDLQKLLSRIEGFKERFFAKNGFDPDVIDIADGLQEKEEDIQYALCISNDRCTSFDEPMGEEEDNYRRDQLVGDETADEGIISSEESSMLMTFVDKLRPSYREVIVLYYGLAENEPMRTTTIALKLGITPQRIQQLLQAGLKELRKLMQNERLFYTAA